MMNRRQRRLHWKNTDPAARAVWAMWWARDNVVLYPSRATRKALTRRLRQLSRFPEDYARYAPTAKNLIPSSTLS